MIVSGTFRSSLNVGRKTIGVLDIVSRVSHFVKNHLIDHVCHIYVLFRAFRGER